MQYQYYEQGSNEKRIAFETEKLPTPEGRHRLNEVIGKHYVKIIVLQIKQTGDKNEQYLYTFLAL